MANRYAADLGPLSQGLDTLLKVAMFNQQREQQERQASRSMDLDERRMKQARQKEFVLEIVPQALTAYRQAGSGERGRQAANVVMEPYGARLDQSPVSGRERFRDPAGNVSDLDIDAVEQRYAAQLAMRSMAGRSVEAQGRAMEQPGMEQPTTMAQPTMAQPTMAAPQPLAPEPSGFLRFSRGGPRSVTLGPPTIEGEELSPLQAARASSLGFEGLPGQDWRSRADMAALMEGSIAPRGPAPTGSLEAILAQTPYEEGPESTRQAARAEATQARALAGLMASGEITGAQALGDIRGAEQDAMMRAMEERRMRAEERMGRTAESQAAERLARIGKLGAQTKRLGRIASPDERRLRQAGLSLRNLEALSRIQNASERLALTKLLLTKARQTRRNDPISGEIITSTTDPTLTPGDLAYLQEQEAEFNAGAEEVLRRASPGLLPPRAPEEKQTEEEKRAELEALRKKRGITR